MSYIPVQPKSDIEADGVTIISCDSTNFKAGQKGYSAFEAEVACAQWFTSKEDYFIRGAPEVILKSDAKNLDGLLRTELGKIENPRLQKMCERMMPYNLRVEHVRLVDNNIADFGSRYPRNISEVEEFKFLRPTICTKSRRVQKVQFDSADTKVEKLARIASECPQYQMMIYHI